MLTRYMLWRSAAAAGNAPASSSKFFLGKIKILHPQNHLITYDYALAFIKVIKVSILKISFQYISQFDAIEINLAIYLCIRELRYTE